MTYPIPKDALDDRLAFVGTAGSGKTYNAGSGVEILLARKARAIIVDPLGVWWGLRLKPDGKSESPYDVVIFGGPHGDIAINEHAGALIGETVSGMAESCIIDLSQIGTKAGERRFMLTFLTALYRKTIGDPVHLVVDEADMWAPQRLLDKDGEAAKLLGMMETIVRRGRVKGFIPWLITQRPAVLSKDVLSQADGLISFKLTSSQDRSAIGAWIEGQADQQQGKSILASLPSMQRGQGVVWVPGRGILETASFPEKGTFDSSRTPKRGEAKRAAELTPLNLGQLKERLSTIEAETKANDPKVLRARIAELEKNLPKSQPDTAAIQKADQAGYTRGYAEGISAGREHIIGVLGTVRADIGKLLDSSYAEARRLGDKAFDDVRSAAPKRDPIQRPPQPRQMPSCEDGVSLPKAERLILIALAQYPTGRTKNQVAILSGYAVNGGGFNNALSALRKADRIKGSDPLQITEQGLRDLGKFDPLPVGDELLQHWRGQLGKAERAALDVLAEVYPERLPKEEVAARAGYEAGGGGFNNALSRLRSLELIEGRGELGASEALFG